MSTYQEYEPECRTGKRLVSRIKWGLVKTLNFPSLKSTEFPPIYQNTKLAKALNHINGFFLNFRWGVNFPRNFGSKMLSLTMNKIGLERVGERKENNNKKKKRKDGSEIDLQLLKGMCFWMGKDLEIMEKENREMKRLLDEMKLGRNNRLEESKGGGRKLSESNGEVQRWRSYKSERQEEEKKVQQPNKVFCIH
ncbi:hypothetical protein JHK82_033515 [Glycine max]|nr:hypothetical protein JHK85_034233 [Glycine max]KAG4985911.1 hypothetical protein JHK86_033602 [Glycine max]KAG5119095.1 hypothetical protein JHK82_033515 [Glycine max]KAG5140087.1 hypothetical protein JHK84_033855 [Glycine max]